MCNCTGSCNNPNALEYGKCFKAENNNGCDCGCGNGTEPTRILNSYEFHTPYNPTSEKKIIRQTYIRSDFV